VPTWQGSTSSFDPPVRFHVDRFSVAMLHNGTPAVCAPRSTVEMALIVDTKTKLKSMPQLAFGMIGSLSQLAHVMTLGGLPSPSISGTLLDDEA
jgi:hypothetical protein